MDKEELRAERAREKEQERGSFAAESPVSTPSSLKTARVPSFSYGRLPLASLPSRLSDLLFLFPSSAFFARRNISHSFFFLQSFSQPLARILLSLNPFPTSFGLFFFDCEKTISFHGPMNFSQLGLYSRVYVTSSFDHRSIVQIFEQFSMFFSCFCIDRAIIYVGKYFVLFVSKYFPSFIHFYAPFFAGICRFECLTTKLYAIMVQSTVLLSPWTFLSLDKRCSRD